MIARSFVRTAILLVTAWAAWPATPVRSHDQRIEEGTIPALQPSDQTLRCGVNLSGHAFNYPPSQWASVPLITDFSVFLDTVANPAARYNEVLARALATNPGVVIGRYLSGARVQSSFKQYPPEAVDSQKFLPAMLRSGTDIVDLEDPGAARQFTDFIVDQFRDFPRPILFLDNMVHPSALPGWIPWKHTCALLSEIRSAINRRGALLVANIAVASWAMSDADVDLLTSVVDGMAFEMPFHAFARQSPDRIERQIEVYRRWLDRGKIVVMIPVTSSDEEQAANDLEVRFVAAFAMVVRRPGDRLFVAWPFWKANPDWNQWPADFGPPLADYQLDRKSLELTRSFSKGLLRVDVATKIVTTSKPK